ncbi:FtsX-like permease family protein [Marinobacterium rhizophilum]|uniref:ABC transporter permease n=1 Tax=Marinobacterium rhizophilum TaxID=420402 RepID=A0ABY5HLT8_9GAMM|nr:FtsX-like permease family protein [Marinobacterium rhizophilum]UTW11886.1 ABC transporter permease [Marinobacterium rhizophilum]
MSVPHLPLGRVYLSHYQRHPGQLLGLLLILACAAMLWSGIQSLTGRGAAAIEAALQAQAPQLSVQRLDGSPLAIIDFSRLRRAGFCVTPRLHLLVTQDAAPGARQAPLRLLGVDPLTADCLVPAPGMAPMLDSAREQMTQASAGASLGLWGTTATLQRWRQQASVAEYPLYEQAQLPADLLLGDIGTIARLAERQVHDSRLELLLPAPLSGPLPPEYEAVLHEYGVSSAPLARSFLLSLKALGWLGLLVAALLVRAVYLFAMEQRRRSLDVLYRHGVPLWRLRLYLVVEMLLLCVLGGALGVWLGTVLAGLLADGFRGTLAGLFGVQRLGAGLSAGALWLQAALVLLVLLGWACSDILLLRARERSAGATGGEGPWGWIAGVLLMQAGGLGLGLATSLWLIFAATGACLLGAGLLLPRLLGVLLGALQAVLQRQGRVLLEWSCSELQAQCRLLRLPLLALAFAIASAIGIQAMVAGFETTFVRWLEQRLQGELYLDPGRAVQLQDWLEPLQALPQVALVQPRVRGRGLVEQQAVEVLAVDTMAEQAQGWAFLASVPQPWQALQGQAVLVNEQLARRQGIKLGDWIKVRLGALEKLRQVVAIYADYGRPDGEILLSLQHLPEALPGRHTTFVLGLLPGAPPDWRRWEQQYDWLAGSRLRDQATLKRAARAQFARTFSITAALSGLTLLLSGVALALMAHALLRLRARHYTWIHVCGLTRAQLRRRLCAHAMLLTTALAVLATPLGVFLSWVLVARVNPVAFGWALPLHLYPLYWLQVWLLCLLIGGVTGVLMASPVRLETLSND